MYKKLSRNEERLIREHSDPNAEPPRRGVIIKNILFFVLGFLLFVLLAWFVFSQGIS